MTRLAIALLERLVPDSDALAGDLLEEFERRRSLTWLWSQVIAAAATTLLHRSGEIRPLKLVDLQPVEAIERSRRLRMQAVRVNLTPSPLDGVGGLTLAVVLVVLGEVASQLWWVVLASMVSGTMLGLVLIRRHRSGFSRQRSLVFEGLIRRSTPAVLLLLAIATGASAQTATPAPIAASRLSFDVTSVKTNTSGARSGHIQPGRFAQGGLTLRQLVSMAYGTKEIVGGSEWIDSERFDVEGKGSFDLSGFLPGRDGSPPPVYLMLRQLLEDRFALAVHRARQDRPVYALVTARRDRAPGPQLTRSTFDCDALLAETVRAGRPPALPGPGAGRGAMPRCAVGGAPGHVIADSIDMSRLAGVLSSSADRVVIDRTDLRGRFNVDLQWTPELAAPTPNANAAATDAPPALVTAIQEQLGLKLEATTALIEVIVVDRAS
ncbi:MAG TPA: TIGR03435 family protein, partial [Vicinamibacterales bacterium]|nr:TIGR03435 family protein [Vicinamibacterales bacterium]